MEKSEQINELASALSKAQGKFKSVLKGSTAKIITKKGGEYSYQYADLATVLNTVMPIVSENGLSICQGSDSKIEVHEIPNMPDQRYKTGETKITTMLMHTSGQWIKNVCTLPYVENGNNDVQAIGSTVTFGRRYEVCSILGIASQKDTDGILPEKLKKTPTEMTPPAGVKSMKEYCKELWLQKFGDMDKFSAFLTDNGIEQFDGLKEIEYSVIFNKIKAKKNA